MKTLLLATAATLALLAAPALVNGPDLQAAPSVTDCAQIQGTIPVADDAPVDPAMAQVSREAAESAALRTVPDATVVDTDLEEEDGFLVYEVDLVQDRVEYDVIVDAGSGEVLCSERD